LSDNLCLPWDFFHYVGLFDIFLEIKFLHKVTLRMPVSETFA